MNGLGGAEMPHSTLIATGSGWGATDMGTAFGAYVMFQQYAHTPPFLNTHYLDHTYPATIPDHLERHESAGDLRYRRLRHALKMHFECVRQASTDASKPLIIGGDHALAISTWSAIAHARDFQPFGLLWIDAHLDAHTPETSPSMAYHGMPTAVLMGHGDPTLTHLAGHAPIIAPEHIIFIGARDYEAEEYALLRQLGCQIYSTQEVNQEGFSTIFQRCISYFAQQDLPFGVSLDIDVFDPKWAPGTGARAPDGLHPDHVLPSLQGLMHRTPILGLEVVEFNPKKDVNGRTHALMQKIMNTVTEGDPHV